MDPELEADLKALTDDAAVWLTASLICKSAQDAAGRLTFPGETFGWMKGDPSLDFAAAYEATRLEVEKRLGEGAVQLEKLAESLRNAARDYMSNEDKIREAVRKQWVRLES